MPRTKGFDAYSCIPSAQAIRKRLVEIQEQARKLGILLRTAEAIEREGAHTSADTEGQQNEHA
jgi:hypothetical protein